MAENDILGIGAHLDISDIQKSINELINNLEKIGVKTETLSQSMTSALNNIANSTDDMATKQKKAMEVVTQCTEEARQALERYPEQIRLAKDSMEQTGTAVANLEKSLSTLNSQLQGAVVGSDKYNELRGAIAGVQQQIDSNRKSYQEQLVAVQQMESGYSGLVSMVGLSNTATAAGAVAHGAVAAATMAEAGTHVVNSGAIQKEGDAIRSNNEARSEAAERGKEQISLLQQEAQTLTALTEQLNNGSVGEEKVQAVAEQIKSYIDDIKSRLSELQSQEAALASELNTIDWGQSGEAKTGEGSDYGERKRQLDELNKAIETQEADLKTLEEAYAKYTETTSQNAQTTREQAEANEVHVRTIEDVKNELEEATKEYNKMLGLSEDAGKIKQLFRENAAASQYERGLISDEDIAKLGEAREKVQSLKEELKEMKAESSEESTTPDTGKYEELNKQYEATKEHLKDLQAEYEQVKAKQDALSEKDTLSPKQMQELENARAKLQELEKNIAGCTSEMEKMRGKTAVGALRNLFDKASEGASKLKDGINDGAQKLQEFVEKHPALKEIEDRFVKIKDVITSIPQKTGMSEGVEMLKANATQAGEVMSSLKDKTVNFLTANGKFQNSLKEMGGAFSYILGPMTGMISGMKTMVVQMARMAMTPLGAVITAIALAFKAFHTWLSKSADGQRVMAKLSAYIGSIMSSLIDIIIKVGRYLFHAFADANGPMHDFAVGVVRTFKSAFKTVYDIIGGTGKMLKGVWEGVAHRNWSVFEMGAKQLWNGLKGGVETVKNAFQTLADGFVGTGKMIVDGVNAVKDTDWGALVNNMTKNAREAANLAAKEVDSNRQLSEAKRDQAKASIEIAKEQEKIYTLTGKEKDAQIEKVKQMKKELYDKQIHAQQTLLSIQQRRNQLHEVSLENLGKERELQTQVYQLMAQQASSTRMLTRMQASNQRSMASKASAAQRKADAQARKEAKQGERVEQKTTAANEVITETDYKNALARAQFYEQIEERITDARIAAEKDRSKKVIAEKNRSLEKELYELSKQMDAEIKKERDRQKAEFEARQKLIKARGGKGESWSEDKINDSEIEHIKSLYEELRKLKVDEHFLEEERELAESIRDYLKAYGGIQEQIEAISEDYDNRKLEAKNPWEGAALEQKKQDEISKAKLENLKKTMDWDSIFNDLSSYSVDFLEGLRDRLADLLKDPSIRPSDAKTISDKIADIDKATNGKQSFLSFRSRFSDEQERLQREADLARNEYTRAQADKTFAGIEVGMAQNDIRKMLPNYQGEIKSADKDKIFASAGVKPTQELIAAFNQLAAAEGKLIVSSSKAATAMGKMQNAVNKADAPLKDKIAGFLGGFNEEVQEKFGKLPALLDELGMGEIGEKVSAGLSGVNSAAGAAASFASGDYIGAALQGVEAIKSFSSLLGGGSNHDDMVKLREELGKKLDMTNEHLQRITEELANSYGANAIKKKEEIEAAYEKQKQGYLNYSASLMGDDYGRNHSQGYYWNRDATLSEDLKTLDKEYGLNLNWGGEFVSLGNKLYYWEEAFQKLTPEIIADLRRNHNDIYQHMVTSQSNGDDMKKYLDMAADSYEEYQNSLEQFQEQITTTTKENLLDDFLGDLYEFADGADDVMQNLSKRWQEMVNRMVINNVIGAGVQEELEKWYEDLASLNNDYIEGRISDAEYNKRLNELKQQYDDYIKEGEEKINQLKDIGIVKSTDQDEQSATANSIQNISYEQADSLIGIGINHTILLEQTLEQEKEQTAAVVVLATEMPAMRAELVSINESVKIMEETGRSMNIHLATISNNTGVLPAMQEDLSRLRKLVEEQ